MPKDNSIKSVLIIGSGPIVIGQACEFDYAGSQSARSIREEGIEVILNQFQSGNHHDRSKYGRSCLFIAIEQPNR